MGPRLQDMQVDHCHQKCSAPDFTFHLENFSYGLVWLQALHIPIGHCGFVAKVSSVYTGNFTFVNGQRQAYFSAYVLGREIICWNPVICSVVVVATSVFAEYFLSAKVLPTCLKVESHRSELRLWDVRYEGQTPQLGSKQTGLTPKHVLPHFVTNPGDDAGSPLAWFLPALVSS